jgi:hypothetical protein
MSSGKSVLLKACFGGSLFLLVLLLATPAFAQRYTMMPQFALGDGWSSDLFFTNQTATAVTGVIVSFYGDNGNPMSVTTNLGTDISFALNLNPGASQIMRIQASGALHVGYVVVEAPYSASIVVTEMLRYEQGGVIIAELGVPQVSPNNHFTFPVEVNSSNRVYTGVALANPAFGTGPAMTQTLVVNLIDSNGVVQNTKLVTLQAGEHIARFLDETSLFSGLDNFAGSVSVSGINPFGAIALREDKGTYGTEAVDDAPVLGPFVVSSPSLSEFEPNDSRAQAQQLTASSLVNGTIGNNGDVDYFYFDGSKDDVVSAIVDTQGLGSQLDSVICIEQSNGLTVTCNDQNGLFAQNDSFIHLALPQSGRYYLEVSDYFGFGGIDYTYRLQVKFPGGTPTPGQPQISTLGPTNGTQGNVVSLTIQGTNLSGATAINFTSATGITVSNIQSTATTVTAQITIDAGAPTGARQVTVTTPYGTSNVLTFTVNSGGGGSYDGTWTGNSTQGALSFTITGGKIMSFSRYHSFTAGCCTTSGTIITSWPSGYAFTGNTFSIHDDPGPGFITFTFAGTFTSSTQASGTLDMTKNPSSPGSCCTGSSSTTWTAVKN